MAYHREFGLDTKIVRIFNTYGPRMAPGDGRVVTNFLEQALAGQAAHRVRRRHARPVRSAGSTTRCAASSPCSHSDWTGPMNIGNPDEFTVLELAEVVLEVTGADVRDRVRAAAGRRPHPAPARHHARAARVLGWKPEVDLRAGVTQLASGTGPSGPRRGRSRGRRPGPRSSSTTRPATRSPSASRSLLADESAGEPPGVVVVDNGSSDGSVAALRRAFPDVRGRSTRAREPRLRRRRRTAGSRRPPAPIVAVCNPDLVVATRDRRRDARGASPTPAVGAAGPAGPQPRRHDVPVGAARSRARRRRRARAARARVAGQPVHPPLPRARRRPGRRP